MSDYKLFNGSQLKIYSRSRSDHLKFIYLNRAAKDISDYDEVTMAQTIIDLVNDGQGLVRISLLRTMNSTVQGDNKGR